MLSKSEAVLVSIALLMQFGRRSTSLEAVSAMRPTCDDKPQSIQCEPQSWCKLKIMLAASFARMLEYIHIDGSNSTSLTSAQNRSIEGGFWSSPPTIGLAATVASLHFVLKASFSGQRATNVPCFNLFDCTHLTFLPAFSVENVTRNAGPLALTRIPLIWTLKLLAAFCTREQRVTCVSVDICLAAIKHLSVLMELLDGYSERSNGVLSKNLIMSAEIVHCRRPRTINDIMREISIINRIILVGIPSFRRIFTFFISLVCHKLVLSGNLWQISPCFRVFDLSVTTTNMLRQDISRDIIAAI